MDELLEYRRQLLAHWQQVVDDLRQTLQAIPPARRHQPLEDGGWTPHQIMAHLRDVEAHALLPRLERILAEETPYLPNFNEQDWMQRHYQPQEPLEAILNAYADLRARQLALLRNAPGEAWSRTGRHPWWGKRTLQWWVERSLAHAREHLEQLQQAVEKYHER